MNFMHSYKRLNEHSELFKKILQYKQIKKSQHIQPIFVFIFLFETETILQSGINYLQAGKLAINCNMPLSLNFNWPNDYRVIYLLLDK